MSKDYYSILGVSKDATEDDIKKAFRKISKESHPDMQIGKSDAEKKAAEERFKEAAEAYETLSDKDKRQKYDMFGSNGPSQHEFSSAEDAFSYFARRFGGVGGFSPFSNMHHDAPDPNSPEDGADIQIKLDISFKESLFGVEKQFDIDIEEECCKCHGTGTADGKGLSRCTYCNGTGMFTQTRGFMMMQSTCPYCQGQGYMNANPCSECHGSRRKPRRRHINLKIPSGVHIGTKLRIAGSGQSGLNGGKSGDLYVILNVEPSDIFKRKGDDLYTDLYISPIIASIGGEVDVYTPYGNVKIKIPAETMTGKCLRIPGKGVKAKDKTGDLYLDVQLEPLVNLTKEQKDLLKAFNATVTEKNLQKSEERRKQLKALFN